MRGKVQMAGKVIQIAASKGPPPNYEPRLYALRDDGTIFLKKGDYDGWERLDDVKEKESSHWD